VHAVVDALGNPIALGLTAGHAPDLDGADRLLPGLQAAAIIADEAYDADARMVVPIQAAGKEVVIPSKRHRKHQRAYDRDLYKARHLIENVFAKLKQFRAIATRYDKTDRNFLAAIQWAAAYLWLI
jgi:transposase